MAPRGFALLGTLTLQFCSIGSSPHQISPEGSAGMVSKGETSWDLSPCVTFTWGCSKLWE